jgi:hypothetical protein
MIRLARLRELAVNLACVLLLATLAVGTVLCAVWADETTIQP